MIGLDDDLEQAHEVARDERERLEAQIIAALQTRPGLDLLQIAEIVNIKAGPRDNPLSSPLNQCLVRMRDGGQIRTNNLWGEPRFFLVTC
jgi:hypothetical protein